MTGRRLIDGKRWKLTVWGWDRDSGQLAVGVRWQKDYGEREVLVDVLAWQISLLWRSRRPA